MRLANQLYCHEVGTPQQQDVLVLDFPDEPKWMSDVKVTDDRKFVVASIRKSCEPVSMRQLVTYALFGDMHGSRLRGIARLRRPRS